MTEHRDTDDFLRRALLREYIPHVKVLGRNIHFRPRGCESIETVTPGQAWDVVAVSRANPDTGDWPTPRPADPGHVALVGDIDPEDEHRARCRLKIRYRVSLSGRYLEWRRTWADIPDDFTFSCAPADHRVLIQDVRCPRPAEEFLVLSEA